MHQLIGAFNTFNYNKRELMRLRGRADSDARLFAGVSTPFDDIEQLVDLAKEKPGKYRQFLEGIQSIRTSGEGLQKKLQRGQPAAARAG